MVDSSGRQINYMRISITDRCNLRCKYCMPDGIETVPMSEILTFEEIIEIVRAAAGLGISKIKITGGEPLVRKGCANLVKMIKDVHGIAEVTLTTNGILLEDELPALKNAGIDGINVSLDTLNRKDYEKLTGVDGLEKVISGIEMSLKYGIKTKINVVSIKHKEKVFSDDCIRLIELARNTALDIRFIEIMPIGNGKKFDLLGNDILFHEITTRYPAMEKDNTSHGNGPAVYYKIPGFMGSIGFISALHGKFCDSCNRIRLSSKGYLKACLCYDSGEDLMPIIRKHSEGDKSKLLQETMANVIYNKPVSHCFEEKEKITEDNYMTSIGG